MSDINKPTYMKHLNGMRGIAILLVVLFHFSINNSSFDCLEPLKKGYLGVEIFMVIMGYLFVTGLQGNAPASFFRFITKKAKRILLPLSFVILFTVTACFMFLDAEQNFTTYRTGLTALLSVSNYELAITTSDYFASNAALNPFLHTWYTSFAIQFFVIAYIFYLISTKVSQRTYMALVTFVAVLSFICAKSTALISMANAIHVPSKIITCLTSYYATFPRLWITIAGCGIIFLPKTSSSRSRNALVLLGVGMIIAPLFLTLKSYDNILVTIGSAILIFYTPGTLMEKALNSRCLQWLGKFSFSIFLIHMPVVAFYRLLFIQAPNLIISLILIVLIFLLAWVFHKYVESYKGKAACFYRYVPLLPLLICLIGVVSKKRNPFPHTDAQPAVFILSDNAELRAGFDQENIPYRAAWRSHETVSNDAVHQKKTPFTQLGNSHQADFVLIGDSHAHAYVIGLHELCQKHNLNGVALNALMLPFTNRRYIHSDPGFCLDKDKYQAFFSWLAEHPELETVIIAFSYAWADMYLEEDWDGTYIGIHADENIKSIRPFLQKLKELHRNVIVFAPLPRFKENNMYKISRHLQRHRWAEDILRDEYSCTQEAHQKRWGSMIDIVQSFEQEGLCHLIDPTPALLRDHSYYAIYKDEIIFFDSNHITAKTSRDIAKHLEQTLLQHLRKDKHTEPR